MKVRWHLLVYTVLPALLSTLPAQAQNVKITPLGARNGDFCFMDRALLFEDPTGVRILYDPGNTIAGATDARLGAIHAVLVSHAHGDHMGGARMNQDPNNEAGNCNTPPPTVATPNSIAAEIAAEKNAAIIAGPPLASFLGTKVRAVLSSNSGTAGCPAAGLTNEMTFPRTAPCTAGTGHGAKRTIRLLPATQGVQVAVVTAEHPNELAAGFLTDASSFTSNGLPGAYVGLANGFVVTFTNGLKVYLSGDTGLSKDMKDVVRAYYAPNLSVINISDTFVTGPQEASFAVANLLRTNAVIPSHANEGATNRGVLNPGTRTDAFIQHVSQGLSVENTTDIFINRTISVYVPLSGITLEFDGFGRCVTACQGR